MNLLDYARYELNRLGKDEGGMQEMMNNCLLELIKMFCEQEHTGFSASYCISILTRLLKRKPISPLTGEKDEWIECSRSPSSGERVYQNRRCSSVFKILDGEGKLVSCYDIDAVVYSDNGGITWFTSNRFRKDVKFPYFAPNEPERVYIEYTEEVPLGFTGDKYDIITNDPARIKALYERKRKELDNE